MVNIFRFGMIERVWVRLHLGDVNEVKAINLSIRSLKEGKANFSWYKWILVKLHSIVLTLIVAQTVEIVGQWQRGWRTLQDNSRESSGTKVPGNREGNSI